MVRDWSLGRASCPRHLGWSLQCPERQASPRISQLVSELPGALWSLTPVRVSSSSLRLPSPLHGLLGAEAVSRAAPPTPRAG